MNGDTEPLRERGSDDDHSHSQASIRCLKIHSMQERYAMYERL